MAKNGCVKEEKERKDFKYFLKLGIWPNGTTGESEVWSSLMYVGIIHGLFKMAFLGSNPRDSDSVDQGICILVSTRYRSAEDHTLRNSVEEVISKVSLQFAFLESFVCIESIFLNPCHEYEQSMYFFNDSHSCRQEYLHEICSGFLLCFDFGEENLMLK